MIAVKFNGLFKIESWQEYLNKYIVPLNTYSQAIIEVAQKAEKYHDKTYAELDDFFKEALISGLKDDGKYSENALAKFYKDMLGIMVDDPEQLLQDLKEEYKGVGTRILFQHTLPENNYGTEYVLTKHLKRIPSFIAFSRLVLETTSFIIAKMKQHGLKVEKRDMRIEKPADLVIVTKEFIEKAINTSINYNRFTFFAWSLRKITPKYMYKIYPNITKKIENFLGITTIYEFNNENIYNILGYRDYFQRFYINTYDYYNELGTKTQYPIIFVNGVTSTQFYNLAKSHEIYIDVYGKPETIGGAICRLNDVIFTYIRGEHNKLSKWFKNIPDIKNIYFNKIKRKLKEAQWEENPLIKKYKLYILEDILKRSIISPDEIKLLKLNHNGFFTQYIIFERVFPRNPISTDIAVSIKYVPLKPAIRMINLINNLYQAIYLGLFDFAFNMNKDELLLVKRG